MESTAVLNHSYVSWQMFAYIVGGLVIAVTALALYIKHLHSKSDTNLVTMTKAIADNAKSNEHLAIAIDALPERITDKIELRMKK